MNNDKSHKIVTDFLQRELTLPVSPQRIISLVPSQTELLFHLGVEDRVVGVTKFCIHPLTAKQKTIVGGTKTLHYAKIDALQPDFILANKEENTKEIIETLEQKYPVWVSDIFNLDDALRMIKEVGSLVEKDILAEQLQAKIREQFSFLALPTASRLTAAYLIWNKPIMAAATSTFIDDMLDKAGFENIFRDKIRYPILELEDLVAANPTYLFLSSEPFPFKQKHIDFYQKHLPQTNIRLVDGELFSWYGSRLLHSADYFKQLK